MFAAPAKGVIRLQRGHLKRTVPVLLVVILAGSWLATAGHAGSNLGPNALTSRSEPGVAVRGLFKRPIIGRTLPPIPGTVSTQQTGSGPDPDSPLTAATGQTFELQPNGSPGSTQNRIAFCSDGVDADLDGRIDAVKPAGSNFNLWIMRSDGSEQYQVTNFLGDEVDPVYDPGGRLLAFAAKKGGFWQIFTVEVRDPTIVRQITSDSDHSAKRHPTFSPDTNYIAYQSDLSGDWDIYKIPSTGAGDPVKLTYGTSNDTDPAWSPAGGTIAFTRETAGIKRVYTMDEQGGGVTAVTNGGGDATASDQEPAWRFGATQLAFASNRAVDTYLSLPPGSDQVQDFNIYTVAAAGEVLLNPVTLLSSRTVTDTTDDTNPSWTQEIPREPTRVIFESKRDSAMTDLWAYQLRDWIWPVLKALPSVDKPSDQRGTYNPLDPVTISVPVWDQDTGVASVVAILKDPGVPTWIQYQGGQNFDASFTDGWRYLEQDCAVVGSLPLTDDDQDGIFTGTYDTSNVARDYIIDIVVSDNAGNTMRYDDIYGFSTQAFQPNDPVLFVDDYCQGQLFLALLGFNNDFTAAWPVASYYTYNPGYHPGTESTVDYDTISGVGGTGRGYDTWRVICRGPIPSNVYQYYLPTVEYQLDPAKLDTAGSLGVVADRAVPVADRAVIWAAPHTGDVWIADGSIMDASVQADVALFVKRGGRLVMSGENLGYALTMDGTRTNTFLSTALRANYVQDVAVGGATMVWFYLNQAFRVQATGADFGIGGLAGDPVAADPWGGGHVGDIRYWYDSGDNPTDLNSSRVTRPANTNWYLDAAEFSVRPDSIEPLDAIKIYGYGAGEAASFGGPAAGLRYEDAVGPQGGKVVFLSFGFEQIHRGYHTPTNIPSHCMNHRSHFIHNALCWDRTGGFQGRVVSISDGGQAVNDPAPIVSAIQGGTVRYAVRCQKDGTYVMQGLPPGGYQLRATRPGYEIDHYQSEMVHGGGSLRIIDFAIKRSEPGAVTGTVTALAGGTPLANVEVKIEARAVGGVLPDPLPVLPDPVKTAADGTYTLPRVPVGDYTVTADGSGVQYGSQSVDVTVNPGDTSQADFALPAAPGTLVVTVTDVDTTLPLSNASVDVRNTTGFRSQVYTDNAGKASMTLNPGTYTMVAAASGYQASAATSVLITPATTTDQAAALKREAPGSIMGRVVSRSGGFIGGVKITVKFGDVEVVPPVTTSTTAVNPGDTTLYNYRVDNVPTGSVTVWAERTGFTASPNPYPAVLVQSSVATRDVNFSMDSMHTFPAGLQLMSMPWDYSQVDAADLLSVSRASLRMATYEASRQQYRLYPNAPADRFRLGTGYWLNLTTAADLSQEGLAPSDPVEIPLVPGWNLIGTPSSRRIDFYLTKIRRPTGAQRYTVSEASGEGILGSGLFAYVLGGYANVATMAPYVGYWIQANEPCYLIISAQTAGLAAGGAAERAAVPTPEGGWLLQLSATAGGAQDTSAYLGSAAAATAEFDRGLDQGKPPVPAMGPYVSVALTDEAWSAGAQSVDIRPTQAGALWNVRVATNQLGERVTLHWGDMSGLPAEVRPFLIDVASGKRVYMRTASSYSFIARQEESRLQVAVEPGGAGQLLVSAQSASGTAAGVAISYVLSRAASVEAAVMNLAGREVARLGTTGVQTAGRGQLLWDGRAANGLRVPAGQYLVRMKARTEDGQEANAVVPLSLSSR